MEVACRVEGDIGRIGRIGFDGQVVAATIDVDDALFGAMLVMEDENRGSGVADHLPCALESCS